MAYSNWIDNATQGMWFLQFVLTEFLQIDVCKFFQAANHMDQQLRKRLVMGCIKM